MLYRSVFQLDEALRSADPPMVTTNPSEQMPEIGRGMEATAVQG